MSEIADKYGYHSILLVYNSIDTSLWIKVANIINQNHKFKYMFAMRTYAVSPEYFVMMYKAFNEIQQDRIMFNIVSGNIESHENSLDHLLHLTKYVDTMEKRLDYTKLWLNEVKSLLKPNEIPKIVMSGTSPQVLDVSLNVSDYHLLMLNHFEDDWPRYQHDKGIMVCAAIVIRDTVEEAEEFTDLISSLQNPEFKKWTIFGTEEDVLKRLNFLENIGATDILIRFHPNDPERNRVHEFVMYDALSREIGHFG
jgi:alkanesulfonate monooxygenase SsuD/methylene tetrahydromethanopterin reductase-like flavin-dependent oxidoreductase (luciferase family)